MITVNEINLKIYINFFLDQFQDPKAFESSVTGHMHFNLNLTLQNAEVLGNFSIPIIRDKHKILCSDKTL